ncbi:hypothetical protein FEM03_07120 [Phragmitibacter flavus]|uniref:Uncharacterized protein n=1 Tax=Phragmitibacter flavus TaxID=2576071 RepID=A0A5R8KG68_9BACT|nr:secretin N-terminal domain-containing protein [Phragmitibacter flavus]TLD71294.1 hypothetical protein FEM03_07120 [Phragmitibacter flavus]
MFCRSFYLCVVASLLLAGVHAQNNAPSPDSPESIAVQFPPGTPIGEVLNTYQRLTGKRLIRDTALEAAVVNIETTGKLSPPEAIEFIEKSLLLAGYALVPSGDQMIKVIVISGDKLPASEGVPMILREADLPQSDQVVNYLLPLRYLDADEAARAFAQVVPPHSYGKITAVPNAQALLITENSNTIRSYVELAAQVDLPPSETKHHLVHLTRADAEVVAEQLSTLLGLETASASGTRAPTERERPTSRQPTAEEAAAPQTVASFAGMSTKAIKPIIQPVERTNSLVIIARPLDIQYIESLIAYLDGESPTSGFISRKLNYIDLTTFVSIAEKSLQRNSKEAGESITPQTTTSTTPVEPSNTSGGFGNRGTGRSGLDGGGLGLGGSGGSASSGFGFGGVEPLDVTKKAYSVLVSKTLVIVDPGSSRFYASGPPDQLRMLEQLADELDVRPKQILLSVIIGEFTVGEDFNFGLDWIRTLENVGNDSLLGGVLNTQGTAFTDISQLGGAADFLPALDGLTVYGQIGKHWNVFLQTLEKTERFHILQKPTITTLNHQSATIYIGQQLAIPGETLSSVNNLDSGNTIRSTTQYIPVRLQLDITPHIYNNNEVMLEFQQQNNDISGFTTISGNQIPNISEQGMRNRLIVPDRTTVMLGGLITERDRKAKSGLPFLVRIPVVKHLFGSTNKTKERRELMIFVQPRILNDGADHIQEQTDLNRDSRSYQRTQEFANPGDGTPLLPLPEWKEDSDASKAQAVEPGIKQKSTGKAKSTPSTTKR